MITIAPGREELPPRRLTLTEAIEHAGRTWLLSLGFDREGLVKELFLDGVPIESETERDADTRCIEISHQLQSGMSLAVAWTFQPARSLYSCALARAAKVERDCSHIIRDAYLCAEGRHPLQLGEENRQ